MSIKNVHVSVSLLVDSCAPAVILAVSHGSGVPGVTLCAPFAENDQCHCQHSN